MDIAIKPFEPRFSGQRQLGSARSKSVPAIHQQSQHEPVRRAASQAVHPLINDQHERITKLESMFVSLQKESRAGRLELHQQLNLAQSSFDRNLKNTTAKIEKQIDQIKADMPTRTSIIQDMREVLLPELKELLGHKSSEPVSKSPINHSKTIPKLELKRPLSPSSHRDRERTPRKDRQLKKGITE